MTRDVRPARRRPAGALELLAQIDMTPADLGEDPPQLEPSAELRLVVAALVDC